MKDGVFVRALWGRGSKDENPIKPYERSSLSLIQNLMNPQEHHPTVVYAWGEQNYDRLKRAGIDAILLGAEPFVNWSGDPDAPADPVDNGCVQYGVSMWRHKFEAIKAALQEHEQVLWLDGDVKQIAPLPVDWWKRLADGPPYRASLRQYKRPQCLWRPRGSVGRKLVPHGALQYYRRDWIDQIVQTHFAHTRTCTDEVGVAKFLDELHGEWIGVEKWEATYEIESYHQRYGFRQVIKRKGPLVFKNFGKW